MRRLAFYIILTTDGMYADPDGGLDHYEPAEDEHRYANELMRGCGGEVMGRGMYDVMTYWDDVDIDDPATNDVEREFARFWRETPKHVVTRGTARPAGERHDPRGRCRRGRPPAEGTGRPRPRARVRRRPLRDPERGWPDRHVPVPHHDQRDRQGQGPVRVAEGAAPDAARRHAHVLIGRRAARVRARVLSASRVSRRRPRLATLRLATRASTWWPRANDFGTRPLSGRRSRRGGGYGSTVDQHGRRNATPRRPGVEIVG